MLGNTVKVSQPYPIVTELLFSHRLFGSSVKFQTVWCPEPGPVFILEYMPIELHVFFVLLIFYYLRNALDVPILYVFYLAFYYVFSVVMYEDNRNPGQEFGLSS